jgi:hypothetical protein
MHNHTLNQYTVFEAVAFLILLHATFVQKPSNICKQTKTNIINQVSGDFHLIIDICLLSHSLLVPAETMAPQDAGEALSREAYEAWQQLLVDVPDVRDSNRSLQPVMKFDEDLAKSPASDLASQRSVDANERSEYDRLEAEFRNKPIEVGSVKQEDTCSHSIKPPARIRVHEQPK